jgi:thiamine biosynthesis lipoprotein
MIKIFILQKRVISVIAFSFFLIIVLFFTHCSRDSLYRESRMSMDTLVSITVRSASKKEADHAIKAGFKEIEELADLLDYYSPTSEITAINKNAGKKPVKVSNQTLDVIKKSLEIARLTDGAYDPTIGPVMKLWDFVNKIKPEQSVLQENLPLVDYRKVDINVENSTVFLRNKGMELDLGGIAKGYAADRALDVITSQGIKAVLVAIAGDIKCSGLKPGEISWHVGIQSPRDDEKCVSENNILASLFLDDQAISTSGDYQRYFIENGIRYHHLLNPKTGMPSHELISVSLIAKMGVMTDALATGVFVMGIDKGIKLLTSLGIDGVFVDKDKKVFITEGLKNRLTISCDYSIVQ